MRYHSYIFKSKVKRFLYFFFFFFYSDTESIRNFITDRICIADSHFTIGKDIGTIAKCDSSCFPVILYACMNLHIRTPRFTSGCGKCNYLYKTIIFIVSFRGVHWLFKSEGAPVVVHLLRPTQRWLDKHI